MQVVIRQQLKTAHEAQQEGLACVKPGLALTVLKHATAMPVVLLLV